ncbi:pleckstrin homology domain-containing family A member 5 isoform X9 [Delphinus delphis]|uniref:pleckstrin homology domain-containing family A member 5 isoform X9 n=1 Tax=Delphinus delphis TaxID=9728 RepID=UPI0028C39E10|nr:pleckstrin homology domain-containing family A member 5 isoform X9 [Delphinus delphis]
MAADLNLEWICSLPRTWTYGITRGGRVFFINEEAKSTTWLHPVTGEAVVTGHRRQSTDLPTGWEEAYTFEGARYYIKACCLGLGVEVEIDCKRGIRELLEVMEMFLKRMR